MDDDQNNELQEHFCGLVESKISRLIMQHFHSTSERKLIKTYAR